MQIFCSKCNYEGEPIRQGPGRLLLFGSVAFVVVFSITFHSSV